MTILQIGTGYTSIPAKVGAATEIVVEELCKSGLKAGYDMQIVDIADKHRAPHSLPVTEVTVPGFLVKKTGYSLGIFHKMKRVIYSVSLAWKLKKIMKQKQGGIIHFHNQYNFFFFRLFTSTSSRKGWTTYYTNHSHVWFRPWSEISKLVKRKYFLEIFSMKRADKVFVLNDIIRTTLVENVGINDASIVTIPNGVNTEVYKPLPTGGPQEELKQRLGLAGRKILLTVGSVCDRKNQLGVLKDLEPFLQQNPEWAFCYAGGIIDETYQAEIKSFASTKNIEKNVFYLGEISPGEALNLHYNLADAFVFGSKSESFGLVILEALSAGLPVILSANLQDIDFVRDIQQYLTIYSSQDELINGVNRLSTDISTQNKKEELAGVIYSRYSWDSVAKMYFEG
ncbi:MAG: glycosyltransferase family 4 protein [Chitinophagaceae bacterium]|nr:glycosyltransferase family 4 protein [Chitinophagaceae bacterium]